MAKEIIMAGTASGVALMQQAQELGFVDFTKSLVSGVFDVVVQSQIDQLKAFAELVSQVSQSLAQYQQDVTGVTFEGKTALDSDVSPKLADYIKNVLKLELSSSTATAYSLNADEFKLLESHLGADTLHPVVQSGTAAPVTAPNDGSTGLIDAAYLKNAVFKKLKAETTQQYNLLVEMMKLGFARIDVTDGHVETKMNMHVTALDEETAASYSADVQSNDWHAGGYVRGVFKKIGFGASGRYTSSRLRVNVSNTNSISRTNLDATMSGEVRIAFATSSFGPVVPAAPAPVAPVQATSQ
jgi:hypothetical protein